MALLFNFKKALSSNLKNTRALECVLDFLARATLPPFLFSYYIGCSEATENGVTSAEGYPSWKESHARELLIELMGGAAKN